MEPCPSFDPIVNISNYNKKLPQPTNYQLIVDELSRPFLRQVDYRRIQGYALATKSLYFEDLPKWKNTFNFLLGCHYDGMRSVNGIFLTSIEYRLAIVVQYLIDKKQKVGELTFEEAIKIIPLYRVKIGSSLIPQFSAIALCKLSPTTQLNEFFMKLMRDDEDCTIERLSVFDARSYIEIILH